MHPGAQESPGWTPEAERSQEAVSRPCALACCPAGAQSSGLENCVGPPSGGDLFPQAQEPNTPVSLCLSTAPGLSSFWSLPRFPPAPPGLGQVNASPPPRMRHCCPLVAWARGGSRSWHPTPFQTQGPSKGSGQAHVPAWPEPDTTLRALENQVYFWPFVRI